MPELKTFLCLILDSEGNEIKSYELEAFRESKAITDAEVKFITAQRYSHSLRVQVYAIECCEL